MDICDHPVNTKETMPTVSVERVRKMVQRLQYLKDEDEVTLMFVLTALFPTVWYNIQRYTNDCYMNGYLQGREDTKNEIERADK